ncbi:MAG: helical backbone metal receptor [Planctomycetia bacterium]|nr:helical backbone metal receptor [Planctomycetia bacterium]
MKNYLLQSGYFFKIVAYSTIILGIICNLSCNSQNDLEKKERIRLESVFPQRIISTAPSITEILFELNLGNQVVGVSRFCHYPPEVNSIPKVGGLYDPNIEAIVQLKPDLVIILEENVDLEQQLKSFNIKTLAVNHQTIDNILDSFEKIGKTCGPKYENNGIALKKRMQNRFNEIQAKTRNLGQPNVLIAIDRSKGIGTISDLFVAGNNPFYNDIIKWAGGQNVAQNLVMPAPILSLEGIYELNPDVIIDLSTDGNVLNENKDQILCEYQKDWLSLGTSIPAIRNKQIYPIPYDYATIPGPRIIILIETLAKILHPDQDFVF